MDSGIESTESSNGSVDEAARVIAMEGQQQQHSAGNTISTIPTISTSSSEGIAKDLASGDSKEMTGELKACVPPPSGTSKTDSYVLDPTSTPANTSKATPSPLRTLAATVVNDKPVPVDSLENKKNNNLQCYFPFPYTSTPPNTPVHNFQIAKHEEKEKRGKMELCLEVHDGTDTIDSNNIAFEVEPPPGLTFANVSPSMCLSRGYEAYTQGYGVLPYENNSLHKKLRTLRLRLKHHQYKIVCPKAKERKLFIAVSLNNVASVEQLLKEGVSARVTDNKERSPLHIAASKGYTDIAKLLLQYGADPNQRDAIGNTALHLAACTSHIPTVTLLLKAGTNVRQADNQGYSPLHLARSKLKLLQRDNNSSSHDIKRQVYQVIEMMQTFLECSGSHAEAELFTSFTTQLTLGDSRQQVENDLSALLDSLNNLSLTNPETT